MAILVDEEGEETTVEQNGEIIHTSYYKDDNYDFTDDGENGPEMLTYKRVNHAPVYPEDSWLANWALPRGTQFEVRAMTEGELYGGREIPTVFTGQILTIRDVDQEHQDDGSLVDVYTIAHTNPEVWPAPHDHYWTPSAMNSVKLPDGRVIKLPWGNGNTVFEGEVIDLHQDITIDAMTIPGRVHETTEEAWAALQPGNVVIDDETMYLVVGRATGGNVIMRRFRVNLDAQEFRRTVKEAIRYSTDIDPASTPSVREFAYDPSFKVIGHVPMPTIISLNERVDLHDVKAGDIIVIAGSTGNTMYIVRWSGYPTGSASRRLKGIRIYSEAEAHLYPHDTDFRAWFEIPVGAGNIFRVGHNPVPDDFVQVPEGAASIEQWLESEIELDTQFLDQYDAERFVAAFTPEILADMKLVGIKTIQPTAWLNIAGGVQRYSSPPAGTFAIYPVVEASSVSMRSIDSVTERVDHYERSSRTTMNLSWYIHPASMRGDAAVSEVTDYTFGYPFAGIFPSINSIMFGLPVGHMRNRDILYLREVLSKVTKRAAQLAREWADGTFQRKAEDAMYNRNIQLTFGLTKLPDETNLIVENQLVRVRPAIEGETATVSINGRGYIVLGHVGGLDERVKNVFAIIGGVEDAAKKIVSNRLDAFVEAESLRIKADYIEPSLMELNRVRREAETAVYDEQERLDKIRREFRNELAGVGTVASQFSQVYRFAEGLLKSVLPVGNGWYTRIAPGGFVEACMDSVTWTDMVADVTVTTPVMLRFRVYYDYNTNMWQVYPYSESPYAKAGGFLHPHIQQNGWMRSMVQMFPEYADSEDENLAIKRPCGVSFCFGAAKIVSPTHEQLLPFMKNLRDYLFAVNRVMVSVQAVDGFRGREYIAGMIASGFASSPEPFVTVCSKLGMTRQGAKDQLSWAGGVYRTVVEVYAKRGEEPPPRPSMLHNAEPDDDEEVAEEVEPIAN